MGACVGSCIIISGLRWSHLTALVICAGIVTLETRCVKFLSLQRQGLEGTTGEYSEAGYEDHTVHARVCLEGTTGECSEAGHEDHTVHARVCLEADQVTVSVEDGLGCNEETDRHEDS